ncbi:HlyD family efflux transporter periplasmic adaptor subunit [Paracoccaceae bacterium Fryx2]|nr:HlyD family efflux transporter periplasmic adaptor subunit [Paracoccaceae bacterium Fryx2]
MPTKPRTILVLAIGAALLGGLIHVGFRSDPVPVDLHRVARGPMQVTVDVEGRTRIRDIYEIAAPISGVARRSPVAVGDPVIRGQTVVAVVEPIAPGLLDARSRMQADAAIKEAEAALQVAETDLTRLEQERTHRQTQFERTRTLVTRGVSSLTQLEDAAQDLAIAETAVENARARVGMAHGALARAAAAVIEPDGGPLAGPAACCVTLTAPVDGVVLAVDTISARPVAAGARLATVGDPADLVIVADLLSSDAVRLPARAGAVVERWGGEPALSALLHHVEPTARTHVSALGIEEQRVDALFDMTSPPQDRPGLGDGFSVFLRIIEWQGDHVLQVPLSATFRDGGAWSVFVVAEGRAWLRPVTLGRRNARFAAVTGGLTEGDLVVTHPGDALADGVRVAERDAG